MTDLRRGVCPTCGRSITLLKDGSIRKHGAKDGAWPPADCEGSWKKPKETPMTDTEPTNGPDMSLFVREFPHRALPGEFPGTRLDPHWHTISIEIPATDTDEDEP